VIDPSTAFATLPLGLRDPLVDEYRSIIQNFVEHRWNAAELSGGRFCEIVYTILDGYASGTFPNTPSKPSNFLTACRQLENHSHVPRSIQILIPRMLPVLYEVRNNRGVGHVGGDVDPNHMDATVVVGMCNWIMAELVRIFHAITTQEAQSLVDMLAEREVPMIWQNNGVKRVLDPNLSLQDQILALLSSTPAPIAAETIREWAMYKNKSYFTKLINRMVKSRYIYAAPNGEIQLLPPGSAHVAELLSKKNVKLN